MGRQRHIARKVIGKQADYTLASKGNQGDLRDDVTSIASGQKSDEF